MTSSRCRKHYEKFWLGNKVQSAFLIIFRPYRPALGIDKAIEEISGKRGILYDTDVVDACLKIVQEKRFIKVIRIPTYLGNKKVPIS